MPDVQKMLTAAHAIKQQYDFLYERAGVTDSDEARVAAFLCLTIAEQFDAALCLVENKISSHAPIIVRSMLEGLANLINLANDPAYLNQIRFENAKSDVTLFDEYAADPEMQQDAAALAVLNGWRQQALPVRDELAGKGFKKQNVLDKFRSAKVEPMYVAYRVLCSFTHNQLSTLKARHAGEYLRYHYEAPTELTTGMLNMAVSILTQATRLLPKFSNIAEADVQASIDKADVDWTEAQAESPTA